MVNCFNGRYQRIPAVGRYLPFYEWQLWVAIAARNLQLLHGKDVQLAPPARCSCFTVRTAGVPVSPEWGMRRELKSPIYTTRLDKLWTFGAGSSWPRWLSSPQNSRISHGPHVIHFCEKCVWSMDIGHMIQTLTNIHSNRCPWVDIFPLHRRMLV